MGAIGKWLVGAILNWLTGVLRGLIEAYLERQRIKKERVEDNKKAEKKLKEAKDEQEIIDSGSSLLKR